MILQMWQRRCLFYFLAVILNLTISPLGVAAEVSVVIPVDGPQHKKCMRALVENAGRDQSFTLENYVEQYSALIPAVERLINIGLQRFQGQSPGGYCYRAVKNLLIDSGLVRKSIDGTWARSAHSRGFLKNRGFINLLEKSPFRERIQSPLDGLIPIGAILVYDGANGADGSTVALGEGIGHIEIKCGSQCFLFDSIQKWPGGTELSHFHFEVGSEVGMESGEGPYRRKLVGVYILDYFSLF